MTQVSYFWKWFSLLAFMSQNSITPIIFRFATTEAKASERYCVPLAVLLTEALKCVLSIGLIVAEEGLFGTLSVLRVQVLGRPSATLAFGVPAVLFALQNTCLQLSAGNLPAALWQVTYQGKILWTASFSVLLLDKRFKRAQWLAIVLMVIGIATVQLSGAEESGQRSMANAAEQRPLKGIAVLLLATLCSGFASVYVEREIKFGSRSSDAGKPGSVWVQNVQLASLSVVVLAIAQVLTGESPVSVTGRREDMFRGFSPLVWAMIVNNAVGGLLVALVLKHADSILRGFASAAATVIAAILAVFFFSFVIRPAFCGGTISVLGSMLLYGNVVKLPGDWWNSEASLCRSSCTAAGAVDSSGASAADCPAVSAHDGQVNGKEALPTATASCSTAVGVSDSEGTISDASHDSVEGIEHSQGIVSVRRRGGDRLAEGTAAKD